jgi:hypothetical protein
MYYNSEVDLTLMAELSDNVDFNAVVARILSRSLAKLYSSISLEIGGRTLVNPHRMTYEQMLMADSTVPEPNSLRV